MKLISRIWEDQEGATSIEYGMTVALLALGIIGGVHSLGNAAGGTFERIAAAGQTALADEKAPADETPAGNEDSDPATGADNGNAGNNGNNGNAGNNGNNGNAGNNGKGHDNGKGKGHVIGKGKGHDEHRETAEADEDEGQPGNGRKNRS